MDPCQVPGNDQAADIERMMALYGDSILRLCFLYLHDRALSEDAVQETFLRAFKSLCSFRGECSEETWLVRIAVNCCKSISRTAWFRHVDRSITLDILPEPSLSHDIKDDTVIVEVMRLPGKYREVILLYYYQGMRTKEIAETLSLPQPTVSSRLKRAKNRLAKRLERWYFDE